MRVGPVLGTLLVLLSAAPLGVAQVEDACMGRLRVTDDPGDESPWPVQEEQVVPAPAMDFLEYTLVETETRITMTVTLSERPPDDPTESYRYWLGFEILTPQGGPYYMDVRISATTVYDEGTVIGPNEWENPRLAEVPVTWDGASMYVAFDRSLLHAMFETDDLTIGSPQGSSDGPHVITDIQGPMTAAPYMQDRIGDPFTFQPLQPCEATENVADTEARSVEGGDEDPTNPVPGFHAGVLLLGVGSALAVRRR